MTTVNDAVETGARALADEWSAGERLAVHSDDAFVAARAMWPILSAGLRGLHECKMVDIFGTGDGMEDVELCRGCSEHFNEWVPWPCPTMKEIQEIDKELGL